MHQIQNVLYEVKKEALKRSSPRYEPNHEQDDIRQQLTKLRTLLRKKDTQIIRLHGQIDDLKQKITLFQYNSKLSTQQEEQSIQVQKSAFSQVPMIMENKELKQNNEVLHQENMILNGKSNNLEAQLRQVLSDNKRLQMKVKQLDILEKMREERFKDQLQKLTPIIVEDNKDFTFLKEGILKLTGFLRQNILTVVFQLFLRCAKECQKQKKVSSFNIFRHYWSQVRLNKANGFLAAVKVYQGVRKLTLMLEEEYGCLRQEHYRDTMNEWVLNSLIQIRHSKPKEEEQKLFRLLGLLYRSKFPIKSEKFQLDSDVKQHFQDKICQEISRQLSSL